MFARRSGLMKVSVPPLVFVICFALTRDGTGAGGNRLEVIPGRFRAGTQG